jgi:hypothetical protein
VHVCSIRYPDPRQSDICLENDSLLTSCSYPYMFHSLLQFTHQLLDIQRNKYQMFSHCVSSVRYAVQIWMHMDSIMRNLCYMNSDRGHYSIPLVLVHTHA